MLNYSSYASSAGLRIFGAAGWYAPCGVWLSFLFPHQSAGISSFSVPEYPLQ